MSFPALVLAARDIARCLKDSKQLKFPVKVTEGLLPVIAKFGRSTSPPFDIAILCKDWRGAEFRSCLLRYVDHAEILYSKDLNFCWRRFAVTKELAHIAFDKDAEWTTDYAALAQQLITQTAFSDGATSFRRSEDICTFGAMELLMPWGIRWQLESLRDAAKTDYEIALLCKVPEPFVNIMLRSEYGKISGDLHRELDEKDGDDWGVDPDKLPPI
jgi:hypothetical protein